MVQKYKIVKHYFKKVLCFHYYIIIFLVSNSNFTKQKSIQNES